MIDVLIITCGREKYLNNLLYSIVDRGPLNREDLRFNVFLNSAADEIAPQFNRLLHIRKFESEQRLSVDKVMSVMKEHITEPIFMKLDEDALLCSRSFFSKIIELNSLLPEAIFSPFPVGLINNLGGPPPISREVIYAPGSDTYFTLRDVHHVGGFARIMPTSFYKQIQFGEGHNEDGVVSSWARQNGKKMFYLENGLIVEHQESTLGQQVRYSEYFGDRKIK